MNLETALLTKIIDEKDIVILDKYQITKSNFSPAVGSIIGYIKAVYHSSRTFHQVPAMDNIMRKFPDFQPEDSDSTLEQLCVEFQDNILADKLSLATERVYTKAQTDPRGALAQLAAEAAGFMQRFTDTRDVAFTDSLANVMDMYNIVKHAEGGLLGLPYPWPSLNAESMGILDSDFIVLAGRPGNMKTWLLNEITLHAFVDGGAKVLYFSNEMSITQISMRLAARLAEVPYSPFRKGALTAAGESALTASKNFINTVKNTYTAMGVQSGIILIKGDSSKGNGVSSVAQKIEQYKPDLVCIDAAYKMQDDREKKTSMKYTNLTHLSQDLKGLANQYEVPIIITHQENRDGEKMKTNAGVGSLAYSDAFGQDADLVYKIILDKEENIINFLVLKSREFRTTGICLRAQPALPFAEIIGRSPTSDVSHQGNDSKSSPNNQRLANDYKHNIR